MRTRTRAGFTLIELMVAMALTLFIMIILSQAFITSLDTFTNMKGIGDMQQNLRVAEVLLRDDLSQDHFEGKRRLSDTTLTGSSALIPGVGGQAPQAGFFAIRRSSALGSATFNLEGADASGLPSYRATDHMLYMTVKRKGNQQQNFFSTSLIGDPVVLATFFSQKTAYNLDPTAELPFATWAPPYQAGNNTGFYASQWAEVFYYLVQTGSTEEPNNPSSVLGTPTFGLYRAQFVMVPDSTNVNNATIPAAQLGTFASMSCAPTAPGIVFFSPADAAGSLRMAPDITTFPASNRFAPGNAAVTLVCPNVVSFQVQVMQLGSSAFDDMSPASLASPFLYDTTRFNAAPAGYPQNGLKAVQVTLRVFDNKTRQTRQVTVVQDL